MLLSCKWLNKIWYFWNYESFQNISAALWRGECVHWDPPIDAFVKICHGISIFHASVYFSGSIWEIFMHAIVLAILCERHLPMFPTALKCPHIKCLGWREYNLKHKCFNNLSASFSLFYGFQNKPPVTEWTTTASAAGWGSNISRTQKTIKKTRD